MARGRLRFPEKRRAAGASSDAALGSDQAMRGRRHAAAMRNRAGAELPHRGDRRISLAARCRFPPGMRRARHPASHDHGGEHSTAAHDPRSRIPSARPGQSVTSASPDGRSSGCVAFPRHLPCRSRQSVTSRAPGITASVASRRFLGDGSGVIVLGSMPTWRKPTWIPVETPPPRPTKPCGRLRAPSARARATSTALRRAAARPDASRRPAAR